VTCLSGRTAAYRTCIFKPKPSQGPFNQYANRFFRSDDSGHVQEHYLPTSMLRRRQRKAEFEQHLPDCAMTKVEIMALTTLHEKPTLESVSEAGEASEHEEEVDPFGHQTSSMDEESAIELDSVVRSPDVLVLDPTFSDASFDSIPPTTTTLSAKSSLLSASSSSSSRGRSEPLDDIEVTVSQAEETCDLLYFQFMRAFLNDFFHQPWGKYHLHSGDDKFLTRFITTRGWQMYVKVGEESCIYTTFKPNWHLLKQCMRWTVTTQRHATRSQSLHHCCAVVHSQYSFGLLFLS
jgi:hypothetical protein